MKLQNILRKVLVDPIGFLSLCFIVIIALISMFASFLAPDKSPNANQMHLPIHSKPPGFTTQLILIPTEDDEGINEEIPVRSLRWDEEQLLVVPYGRAQGFEQPIDRSVFPASLSQKQIANRYIVERTFYWGTDKFGRDLLSRMIHGARISFYIGFVAVMISLFIGILLGGLAGFVGGKTDQIILWFINVMWSIPSLLLVIAISLALGKGLWQVFIAVGLSMWVDVARLVRGQTLSIKAQTFVEAGRGLGFSSFQLFFKHIFPLIIPSLIVISTANFASSILIESGLSFLGIGAQPPTPSWGGMIKDHFRYMLLGKAYLALIPGAAIMSLVLAFMLLGNSLRDALDIKN